MATQTSYKNINNGDLDVKISHVLPPKDERESNMKSQTVDNRRKSRSKQKPKSFIVATSHMEEKTRNFKQVTHRRTTLNRMQAPKLQRTKACHFVTPKSEPKPGEDIKFGVCYRKVCTFAHGLDELNLPHCNFGNNCYKATCGCRFFHPGLESRDEFYTRTNCVEPLLPKTSENSRKPPAVSHKSALKPAVPVHVQETVPVLRRHNTTFLDIEKEVPTPGQIDMSKSVANLGQTNGDDVLFNKLSELGAFIGPAPTVSPKIHVSVEKLGEMIAKGMDLSRFEVVIV